MYASSKEWPWTQWDLKFLVPGAGAAGISGIVEFQLNQLLGGLADVREEALPLEGAGLSSPLPQGGSKGGEIAKSGYPASASGSTILRR